MDIKELLHRIHALIEEYLEIGNVSTYNDLKRENDNLKAKIVTLESDLSHHENMIDKFEDACDNAIDTLKECMEGRI
tara:strand:- start:125 stop:355 length:231 start_codon:yes stop_codon:yes gene_type:complete